MTRDISRQLVDNGFDMVCISMGGANRESYAYVRGVDAFDRVKENIRFLHDYKRKKGVSKPLISFNIVAMNSLLDELPQMIDLAADIGVAHIACPIWWPRVKAFDMKAIGWTWHVRKTYLLLRKRRLRKKVSNSSGWTLHQAQETARACSAT